MVHYVPEGTRTITPHLVVKGGAKAIAFYKAGFGAVEHHHMPAPGGLIGHAQLQIGTRSSTWPTSFRRAAPRRLAGSTSVVIHLYVPDADAACARAAAAGAKVTMPPMDAFWGDRYGQVRDPFRPRLEHRHPHPGPLAGADGEGRGRGNGGHAEAEARPKGGEEEARAQEGEEQ
jgi:uncharacterized glyoxalase superfamily protein PhnB